MNKKVKPLPWLLPRGAPAPFPDPRDADEEGLVAYGGDLSTARLLLAYDQGIFPCFAERSPPLWWSPDPRAVITPESLHVSKSLVRTLRKGAFRLAWNASFRAIVDECARDRPDPWISAPMKAAYERLHELGHAHCVEVYAGDALVGGLYGVQRGAAFAAESMFHRATDMSKVALVVAVRSLFAAGVSLFDVQFLSEHLQRMGAFTIPRSQYLERLESAKALALDLNAVRLDPFAFRRS
jgi:leucyl/phenylalanyl-tRNA---protein transferase